MLTVQDSLHFRIHKSDLNATLSLPVFRLPSRCRTAKERRAAVPLFTHRFIFEHSNLTSSRKVKLKPNKHTTGCGRLLRYVCPSVPSFAENPQCMRSGDILLARYQSIDRSIIPHSQQWTVRQLSVCEKKRFRLNATKIKGK